MPRPSFALWLHILAYLAILSVVAWLLFYARGRIIADLERPAARAQWQSWKQQEETRFSEPDAVVRRRPPQSEAPPALILMRDNFPVVLGMSLLVATVFYAFLAFVLHGTVSRQTPSDRSL